jgi:hypothetical protein
VDNYGLAPSDANLAVGPNHIVQIVNVQLGVFDKATGALLPGFPKPTSAIWTGFGGACEAHNDGDGIVRYDRQAGRWVITQLTADLAALNFHECLAVSQTEDPAGSYYRYDVDFGYRLHDYPKFGVWPNGWYMSANSFLFGFALEGSDMCAWERSKLLAGDASVKVICVVTGASAFSGLLPSVWDGSTAPPNGSPNYFIGLYDTSTLFMFQMTPNYQNPGASIVQGPAYIPVAPFNLPCGDGGTCIPQKDTTQLLSTVGERLMNRLAYRNFGGYEAIVANHSVAAGNTVGIRWYEIRNPAGAPIIFQQGTYIPDADYRWMGSMAMDHSGNIAMGYSKSGPGINPGIFLASREAADAPGTLRAEVTIWTGGGSQLPDLDRWGHYSSIETDPVDDCTFWYTTQYLPVSGTFNWHTRIASFQSGTCITRISTTTTITSDTPDPSVTGQPYLVSFTVTPAGAGTPSGTVTVTDGAGATCAALVAAGSCTLAPVSAGSRVLTASYSGDAAFDPSAGTAAHIINRADTITAITSDSPDPTTAGQAYVVSFTVTAKAPGSGSPTGTVTIGDGAGASCSASVAGGSCTLSSSTAGTLNLVASYVGDANFNPGSGTAPHTVNSSRGVLPAAPSNLSATPAYGSAREKDRFAAH